MNINELSLNYSIIPELHSLIDLVKEVSGKDTEIQIIETLQTDGSTKVARERMPKHIIRIKGNQIARINHLVAHECCHILRIMQANPSDRVVPSSNSVTMNLASIELSDQAQSLPQQIRSKALEFWISGLIMQLTNLPVDTRIEIWLNKNYPALRKQQIKSLKIDASQTLMCLSKKVEQSTISKVFYLSNAMTYAYLRATGWITEENYVRKFRDHEKIVDAGKSLFSMLEGEDKGFTHDLQTIKAWGDFLNISDWFKWIGFEDMPDSYYEQ